MSKNYNCIMCGAKNEVRFATRTSRSRAQNAIFLGALKLHAALAQESLEDYYAIFHASSPKLICTTHFVYVAQYLSEQLVVSGGKISKAADDLAYVNQGDIPPILVTNLNEAIRSFTGDVTVATSDVQRYINTYMQKYFGPSGWDLHRAPHAEEYAETLMETSFNAGAVDEPMPSTSAATAAVETESPAKTDISRPSMSSVKTTSDTSFCPEDDPAYDSEDELKLKETDPDLLNKFFVVQGKKLLELFFLTRCDCHSDEKGVRLDACASAPIIEYITRGSAPAIRRWEGQEVIRFGPKDKLFNGNALACIASMTTGVRMNKLQQWSSEMGLELPSISTYKRIFEEVRPSIERVYEKHQNRVIEEITEAYQNEGERGWDIAVDGAYDSRGHSAELCKVLAVDLRTKLCIHSEVVNRSETGRISGRMEKEGFHRMLRWLQSRDLPIRSIATDRSPMYGTEINSYNVEFGEQIEWRLDPWHLARHVDLHLRAASKRKGYEVLAKWIKSIKKHLYFAIKQGALAHDGRHATHVFNSCLNHVADIHSWNKTDITGGLTECAHDALVDDKEDEEARKPKIPIGSPAHNKLREILLQRVFQRDLALASPQGGTSQCETKNSLDRLYCPKHLYLPPPTYAIYANMSTMHLNALTRAERRGERVVERVDIIHRKFSQSESLLRHKTPVDHIWRKEVYMAFVERRARIRRLFAEAPMENT